MDINFIQEEFKSFFKLKFDSSFTNEIKFYKSGNEYVLEIPIQKITPDEYNLIDSFFKKCGFKRIGRAESVNSNIHNRTNYSIIDFQRTQQENNMKEAKKSQPELDYKDDILKPMRDLKVGQEYVWIMGMEPMLVTYTGPGKKEFTYNFAFVGKPGKHDLSIRDVKDYIKFKLDEGIKMKSNTQVKLRRLIERLIREETQEFGVRWQEFDKNDRIVKKEKVFTTKAALDKFKTALEKKDNFNQFEAWL